MIGSVFTPVVRALACACWIITFAQAQKANGKHPVVFGTVLTAEGLPVEGAEVCALQFEQTGLPILIANWLDLPREVTARVRSDARGRFVLPIEPQGVSAVLARVADRLHSQVVTAVAPGQRFELRLHERVKVKGRVVQRIGARDVPLVQGRVRSFAPAECGSPTRPYALREFVVLDAVTTDAAGRFELSVIAGEECTVQCPSLYIKEHVRAVDPDVFVELLCDAVEVRSRLVERDTGKPIAGVEVIFQPMGSRVRTGADGSFTGITQKECHISTTAIGFSPPSFRADRIGDKAEVDRAGVARYSLSSGDGRALAGADLVAVTTASSTNGSSMGLAVLRSDSGGRVSIPLSAKFKTTVYVAVDGHFHRSLELPGSAEDVTGGKLVVDAVELTGVVLGVDGVPAAHVPIFSRPADAEKLSFPLGQWPLIYTDHAGRFRLSTDRHVPVMIGCRSEASIYGFHRIDPSADQAKITLQLVAAQVFHGRVVDTQGYAVPGAIVRASPKGALSEDLRAFGLWSNSVASDAEGKFRLAALKPDAVHEIRVHRRGAWNKAKSFKRGVDDTNEIVFVIE